MSAVVKRVGGGLIGVLSSLTLAGTLIVLLAVLTFLGTIAQTEYGLYDVQRRYFESWFLVHEVGSVGLPLPGGGLVMGLLFVNLLIGGVVRIRRGVRTAGVVVAHLGMLLLLAAGFVEYGTKTEGHVTLYEGDERDWFQSYTETELAVIELDDFGRPTREWVFADDEIASAAPGSEIHVDGLPFALTVTHWFENASVLPKGPMFDVSVPVVDGAFAREQGRDPQAERNAPAAYVEVDTGGGSRRTGLLWAFDAAPWTVQSGDSFYALDVRKERYSLPFAVHLDKFTKEDHPGTAMPAWFSSDTTVTDRMSGKDVSRPVTISMNEPLREEGHVLYQASWGPQGARPGQRLFSTLAVVQNPTDQWPLVSCLIIAAGLLFHFGRMLLRHVRKETAR